MGRGVGEGNRMELMYCVKHFPLGFGRADAELIVPSSRPGGH